MVLMREEVIEQLKEVIEMVEKAPHEVYHGSWIYLDPNNQPVTQLTSETFEPPIFSAMNRVTKDRLGKLALLVSLTLTVWRQTLQEDTQLSDEEMYRAMLGLTLTHIGSVIELLQFGPEAYDEAIRMFRHLKEGTLEQEVQAELDSELERLEKDNVVSFRPKSE